MRIEFACSELLGLLETPLCRFCTENNSLKGQKRSENGVYTVKIGRKKQIVGFIREIARFVFVSNVIAEAPIKL